MFLLVFMHLAHVVLLVVVVLDVFLVFLGEHCATVVHHHTLTDIHAHICDHFSIDSV